LLHNTLHNSSLWELGTFGGVMAVLVRIRWGPLFSVGSFLSPAPLSVGLLCVLLVGPSLQKNRARTRTFGRPPDLIQ
jgi:hypothetical protein